jgi:hypothetical protein
MISGLGNITIISGCILAALLLLVVVRRFWKPRGRQRNEVMGWQLTFLSTTYAVIIAFMLSDVWNDYQAAETNTEMEANSLLRIYRLAEGIPQQQAEHLRALAIQYGELAISQEWPAMEHDSISQGLTDTAKQLWSSVLQVKTVTQEQQLSLQQIMSGVGALTEHRRIRELQSRSKLPGIFWVVLIVGGSLTVLYSCLFDVEERRMHAVHVVGITFMVALVLVSIADVDRPYGGAIRIQPTAFRTALQSMTPTSAPGQVTPAVR